MENQYFSSTDVSFQIFFQYKNNNSVIVVFDDKDLQSKWLYAFY